MPAKLEATRTMENGNVQSRAGGKHPTYCWTRSPHDNLNLNVLLALGDSVDCTAGTIARSSNQKKYVRDSQLWNSNQHVTDCPITFLSLQDDYIVIFSHRPSLSAEERVCACSERQAWSLSVLLLFEVLIARLIQRCRDEINLLPKRFWSRSQ